MKVIENKKVDEKMYIETLDNGLDVIIIPKNNTKKKFIVWGVNYGSVDNKFIIDGENEVTKVPDGIAHYLEHKMFEQENGTDSLITLTNMGVGANAFTTNNFTAYLYECADKFYEALDEFMDYVQHPYYTHANVEKERGIIGQEISMYDDDPGWQLYLNTMKCMYHKNPIRIDIAGTKETIAEIDENTLYKIYNNFYVPENMAMVVVGDFDPESLIGEINKRMIMKPLNKSIKRITEDEPDSIFEKRKEVKMEISRPIFSIGYKVKPVYEGKVKKEIATSIIGDVVFGKSSNLYQKLYNEGLVSDELEYTFEYARDYAHYIIEGTSNDPNKVEGYIKDELDKFIKNGISEEDFSRAKNNIYGEMIKIFNDVTNIGRFIIEEYFKDINVFDFFNEFGDVTKEYTENVLREIFNEEHEVISIVYNKN